MTLSVPPFPVHKELPSVQEMADFLISALPEPDRKAASQLLVQQILPVKLAGIDDHPRPQRLTVVVYKELARILAGRPANMRLHALKVVAVDAELQRLSRDALNLSIARFLSSHAGTLDAEKLERWLTQPVQELRALSGQELTLQADALARALASWKQSVTRDFPTEWAKHRESYGQTQSAIDAAKSGSFDTASGGLLEFLRDAGQEPDSMAE